VRWRERVQAGRGGDRSTKFFFRGGGGGGRLIFVGGGGILFFFGYAPDAAPPPAAATRSLPPAAPAPHFRRPAMHSRCTHFTIAAAAAVVPNVLGRRRPERRCKFAGNFIDVGLRRRRRRRCRSLSAPDGGSDGRRVGGGRCVRGAHAVRDDKEKPS